MRRYRGCGGSGRRRPFGSGGNGCSFADSPGSGLYRSRNGRFLGVCQGLAEYFDLPVFWVRVLTALFVLFTGLWPGVAVYFIAAFLMKLEPVVQPQSSSEREFYNSYTRSKSDAVSRVRDKFDRLDRRLRRMEDVVTSKDWQWEKRMRE
ncbi:envelope stress response membrane protein PspC [Desulfovibrio ferrophilus]|uniref:Phage shock protein C, PspC n=1 Tax=Desulfovibrio ferrophilus TaxID=241368 RepID=A0A2Z6AU78_9BACT|nr:envelope stress response membrane protein PspC [Desulfovibrio ferrophilus]BBD06787.1 phage shock protein C, PspC [Desulfovibrio ferrophilus]